MMRLPLTSIGIELTRPWWLLGLFALPVLFYFFRRSLVDFARWQRIWSLCAARLDRGAPGAGARRANLVRPTRELFVVFAVDRSESVGEKGMEAVDTFLAKAFAAAGGNRFAVLPFASEPGTVVPGPARLGGVKNASVQPAPASRSTAGRSRSCRRRRRARPQGHRPGRGARSRGGGDPTVLRAADRPAFRRQPHARRRAAGRCSLRGKVEVLDRPAARRAPSPRCSSRPSSPRPRCCRASRSTSRW